MKARRLGPLAAAALCFAGSALAVEGRSESFTFTLDDGREVEASLRIPETAPGPHPVIMLFGGFRRAARVLDLVHTDRPVIWATFDYPFEAPRKFIFPDSLKLAPMMRDAIHGSFDGVGKLYAALKARPDVDPARITVVGASAGAPFATVGAAQHGIPGVVLVQGFGRVTRMVQNLLVRKYEKRWGSWVKYPALWLAAWITWYCEVPVIEDYAAQLKAGQKVFVISATEDEFVPEVSTRALHDNLAKSGAQVEHVQLAGGHLGIGKDDELIAEMLQLTLEWMLREKLL